MSDEYQPNEGIESQLELEGMAAEGMSLPTPMAVEFPVVDPAEALDLSPLPMSTSPETLGAQTILAEDTIPVVGAGFSATERAETLFEERAAIPAAPVAAATTTAPKIVSIAELESTKPSLGQKMIMIFTPALALFKGRAWLAGAIAVILLIVFLFLPPISLAQRLSAGGGYEALDAENPTVAHTDGLKITLDLQAKAKARVKLSTVPRADFTTEALPKDLAPALAALPNYLTPKSPYYMIDVKGKDQSQARMDVIIPNEAEPWETLDLYTWDSDAGVWQWIPATLDRNNESLVAQVAALPTSVMVMQSGMVQQRFATEAAGAAAGGAEIVLTEVTVPGMLIGTLGGLTGDAAQLPIAAAGSRIAVVPVVRNWVPGRDPNWALVSDMLSMESDRKMHVENLVGLAQGGGYPGVVLDYRALQIKDSAAFATFVNDLATALHNQNLWLAVVVDTPTLTPDGSWDTGGYDWVALGKAADQLRVVMPSDPDAYAAGGAVQQLIEWGISRIERHKLIPVFSTLSTDGSKPLTFDEALASLGGLSPTQAITGPVTPGRKLTFRLGNTVGVETDTTSGATRVTVGSDSQWLGTAQWLRARLDMTAKYHLGGVVLRDLLSEGNAPNLIPAIADYQSGIAAPAYALPEVSWEVTGPTGVLSQSTTSLAQPEFSWVAPQVTGTYNIGARVAGLSKGAISVTVGLPQIAVSTTITQTAEVTPTTSAGNNQTTGETLAVPQAAYVADVTVPDNTRFQKGEAFVKTWRLRNVGVAAWPKDTALVFTEGDQMSDDKQVEVGEVAPGATVDVSVNMKAPDKDGTFKATWWLQSAGAKISGGGVTILIKAGEETLVTPSQPVAPVSSGGFELGGHIRNLDIPYRDKMKYAGMNWVKVQVRYGEESMWLVSVAHAAGFKIQISGVGSASMVNETGFEQSFSSWLARYASAGADAIEVWNEPNIDREWQIGKISPQAYTNLLCTAYNAIKAANSGSAVISAAPAPTGYFGGCGPNGCDDKPWLEGLVNAGATKCMDYIGAHHNSGATSPSARVGHPANPGDTHHSWFFLPQTELYYNIFGGSRKIFYTEMGYASQEGLPTFSDQFGWARGINNAQQAAWLAEAASLGSSTGMVRCIIVWNIDFVRYGYDPQDGYAIIRPGGSCPACDTLHNVLGSR